MIQDKNLAIIGCGHMGTALVENLSKKGIFKAISVYDIDKSRSALLVKKFGVHAAANLPDIIFHNDIILVAVKPQDLGTVLETQVDFTGKLVVSIVAGAKIARIESFVGPQTSVVRVMPNLNARIGEAMTELCWNKVATREDQEAARQIFESVGKVLSVREEQMNAATAVAGSGPGFFFFLVKDKPNVEEFANKIFMPALKEAAVKVGFSAEEAKVLAEVTTSGSVHLLDKSGKSCDELVVEVASKGGTTEAGLEKLENIHSLELAIKAAVRRAEELSKKE